MDLPALRTIPFLHGNALANRGRVRVSTGMDTPARAACWPTGSVLTGL